MKLPALLDPARIGGGGFVVSNSSFPTAPEIAVTLVSPVGTVAPSPTTVERTCGYIRQVLPSSRRRPFHLELQDFPDRNLGPELFLARTGAAPVSFGRFDGKGCAINPSIKFDAHFAARAAWTMTFVEIDHGFHLPNVHRRFELDEFILAAWRGTMVFVIITFGRACVLEEQGFRA